MISSIRKLGLRIYCTIILAAFGCKAASTNGITNGLSGGRLGDQLISLYHAMWASEKYGIPLYLQTFPYADQFVFYDRLAHYEDVPKDWKRETLVKSQTLSNFLLPKKANTLYTIPYFPDSKEEYLPTDPGTPTHWSRPINYFVHFDINWRDTKFKKRVQELIAPKYPLNLIQPPKDKISVAIQVRKNSGGFDSPLLNDLSNDQYDPTVIYNDCVFPLKHPPEAYYMEQLKRVIEMFPQEKFYVFIFTDDPQPGTIAERFRDAFANYQDVEINCRITENNHFSNVLEDLFSMTKFDCLIRPDSNLSIAASRLGNYKIIISPAHHHWEGRKLVIDEVEIEENA